MKFGGNGKIKFIKSATRPEQYPPSECPEIAIVGRSNAGKSSFINAIFNTRVAKVSGTPGKTTLLNFFDVGGKYNIVDVPGYGYAARSASEIKAWGPMVENYISLRGQLAGVILIMDIRRKWTAQEEDLVDWVRARGNLPLLLVLTKADKLSRNEQIKAQNAIKKDSHLSEIFCISATKKTGIQEVEEYFYKGWIDK